MATTFLQCPMGLVWCDREQQFSYPFNVSDIDGCDEDVIALTIDLAEANSTGNNFVSRTVSGQVLEDVDNNSSGAAPIPMVTVEGHNCCNYDDRF